LKEAFDGGVFAPITFVISLLFIALGGEVGILNCIRLTSVFNVEEPRFGAADAASPIFF
jgi:hypothetical protein